MLNIEEKHLTPKGVKLIKEITENCEQHIDLIVDHGYTGVVSQGNIEAIIRSVQVSFGVSSSSLYEGIHDRLNAYGLADISATMPAFVCHGKF